jgi:hypothetical protein
MIKDKPLSDIVLDFCSSVKNIRVDYNKQETIKNGRPNNRKQVESHANDT